MNILDIHTHRISGSQHEAIVNLPLLFMSPLRIPPDDAGMKEQFCAHLMRQDPSEPSLLDMAMALPKLNMRPHEIYSIGIHPWEITADNVDKQFACLKKMVRRKQVVAIGEAGLDKLASASMELQLVTFEMQIVLAMKMKLPLVIHCVHAMEELIRLKKEWKPDNPWILHGFRGKKEQALQLIHQGFYLSFGELYSAEALAAVPVDRVFLETDSSDVDIETLYEQAAQVCGVSVDKFREVVKANIEKVFFAPKE